MLDGMTLDQMRAFVAVAEAGSFRAAASRLMRVQSAISHAMAGLEAQLGVLLFDRSGHRPVLTAEGQLLLAEIQAILLKVDRLRARARGLGEGVELGFTLALDPQVSLPMLAQCLRALQQDFPSLSLRLIAAPMGEALQALRDARAVLAISMLDMPDPAIERQAIGLVIRQAVAAPDHPLAQRAAMGGLIGTAELADHLQIVAEDASSLTKGRNFAVFSPGNWRVSDNANKYALIRAGIGWGNLPDWMVADDLAGRRLVALPLAEFGPEGKISSPAYLMHRADAHFGPALRHFIALLRQQSGL